MSQLESLLKKGDVTTATSMADDRLRRDPNDPEALLVRARLHMNSGALDEAADLIEKAHDLGAPEAKLWAAILGEQAKHPEAARMLEEVCKTATRYEPFFVYGRLLNAQKQFAQARPYLEKAVQLDPNQALAHFQLAYASMETGNVKAGTHHLETALKLNPRYTPSYLAFASLLAGNGRRDLAINVLKEGLRHLPGNPRLQTELDKLAPS